MLPSRRTALPGQPRPQIAPADVACRAGAADGARPPRLPIRPAVAHVLATVPLAHRGPRGLDLLGGGLQVQGAAGQSSEPCCAAVWPAARLAGLGMHRATVARGAEVNGAAEVAVLRRFQPREQDAGPGGGSGAAARLQRPQHGGHHASVTTACVAMPPVSAFWELAHRVAARAAGWEPPWCYASCSPGSLAGRPPMATRRQAPAAVRPRQHAWRPLCPLRRKHPPPAVAGHPPSGPPSPADGQPCTCALTASLLLPAARTGQELASVFPPGKQGTQGEPAQCKLKK